MKLERRDDLAVVLSAVFQANVFGSRSRMTPEAIARCAQGNAPQVRMQRASQWRPCGAGVSEGVASVEPTTPTAELLVAAAAASGEMACSRSTHEARIAKILFAIPCSTVRRRKRFIMHQLNYAANVWYCIDGAHAGLRALLERFSARNTANRARET